MYWWKYFAYGSNATEINISKNTSAHSHQYGVPMKDFRLHMVAVIWAETPKSATKHSSRITRTTYHTTLSLTNIICETYSTVDNKTIWTQKLAATTVLAATNWEQTADLPILTLPSSVSSMLAPCNHKRKNELKCHCNHHLLTTNEWCSVGQHTSTQMHQSRLFRRTSAPWPKNENMHNIHCESKKLGHFYFYCNFGKYWSIFKILSMSESERNGS